MEPNRPAGARPRARTAAGGNNSGDIWRSERETRHVLGIQRDLVQTSPGPNAAFSPLAWTACA